MFPYFDSNLTRRNETVKNSNQSLENIRSRAADALKEPKFLLKGFSGTFS